MAGGSLELSDVSIWHASAAVSAMTGAQVLIDKLTSTTCFDGVICEQGVVGKVRRCNLWGPGSHLGGRGLVLSSGVDTSPPDSLSPEPTVLENWSQGVIATSMGDVVSNMLVKACDGGNRCTSDGQIVDY